jgi:BirA family biotin operon repressor/biotin-[acetyl-CoA-carboxylase] ligase
MGVAEALERVARVQVTLKWPNDVLIEGAKVGGILCEGTEDFVVAGIGINVAQARAELPADIDPPATSLALAGGAGVVRTAVASALVHALRPLFTAPLRALGSDEVARYHARDALRGRRVSVDGTPVGIARGISSAGALLLEDAGSVRPVHAGTVRSCP